MKFFFILTIATVTTVTTVTSVTTVTTVTTITTTIIKYKILLLYSSKGNFFTSLFNQPTNRPTTRLIELLGAAKKRSTTPHY